MYAKGERNVPSIWPAEKNVIALRLEKDLLELDRNVTTTTTINEYKDEKLE